VVWSLLSELSGPELSGSFGATRRDEPLGTHQLSRAFASECIGRHSRCFSPAFAGRSTQTTIKEHWPDPLRPQVSRTRQDRPAPPDQGRGFSCFRTHGAGKGSGRLESNQQRLLTNAVSATSSSHLHFPER
jgi:hypothetical protein